MKNFKEYLRETSGKVTITFDHFNPPTVETEKLLNKMYETSLGGQFRIYTSHECNEHYPLDYDTKVKALRKAFPRFARNIINDSKIVDVYDALRSLYEQGYKHVNIVMANPTDIFKQMVNEENGQKTSKGLYNFASIKIIGVEVDDFHSEKILEAVRDNKFDIFIKNVPSTIKESHKLFNSIRTALGLKETYNFRQHIQLPTLSEEREAFVSGELFKAGDVIEVKDTKQIGQVKRLGSNYVIIETYEGQKQRKWIKDIIKVEEAVINKMLDSHKWSEPKKLMPFKDSAK